MSIYKEYMMGSVSEEEFRMATYEECLEEWAYKSRMYESSDCDYFCNEIDEEELEESDVERTCENCNLGSFYGGEWHCDIEGDFYE